MVIAHELEISQSIAESDFYFIFRQSFSNWISITTPLVTYLCLVKSVTYTLTTVSVVIFYVVALSRFYSSGVSCVVLLLPHYVCWQLLVLWPQYVGHIYIYTYFLYWNCVNYELPNIVSDALAPSSYFIFHQCIPRLKQLF